MLKCSAFYENERFITVFTRTHYRNLSWDSCTHYTTACCIPFILSCHLCLGLPNCIFFRFWLEFFMHSWFFPWLLHASPSHPPCFDNPNNIWWRVQIMMSFAMKVCPSFLVPLSKVQVLFSAPCLQHGPQRKSPGDEQKTRRGLSSEMSVSPHHSQSTNLPCLQTTHQEKDHEII
jgi:hypothetical protein